MTVDDPPPTPSGRAAPGRPDGGRTDPRGVRLARTAVVVLVALTLVQLAVGASSDLPQFVGKGFGARLVAYPVLMLAVPVAVVLRRRALTPRGSSVVRRPLPWAASALVASPFFVDVSGNTLGLYDAVVWWDDANHALNWFLLSAGIGLLLRDAGVGPPRVLAALVTGTGAVLAIGWELAEWATYIRFGTELGTAYTDTLGDEALGTLGAAVAGWVVARRAAARGGPGAGGPAAGRTGTGRTGTGWTAPGRAAPGRSQDAPGPPGVSSPR